MSWSKSSSVAKFLLVMLVLLGARSFARASNKHGATPFKYEAGTEKIPKSCQGFVEVGATGLSFKCNGGSVSVPYTSIKLMQYRPNISRKIRKMNIKWEVSPGTGLPFVGGHKNRYFAVVYEEEGATRAIVLDVPPQTMRPYLAEIDVKAGKRVEVEETEEYD
ncbi:MAG TPA: hypothetical protein VKV95_22535 [Terriglobia bacterium]|nr:hypothetical protein [Terriglobia bacterium]